MILRKRVQRETGLANRSTFQELSVRSTGYLHTTRLGNHSGPARGRGTADAFWAGSFALRPPEAMAASSMVSSWLGSISSLLRSKPCRLPTRKEKRWPPRRSHAQIAEVAVYRNGSYDEVAIPRIHNKATKMAKPTNPHKANVPSILLDASGIRGTAERSVSGS